MPRKSELTALERAQDIIYDAWDAGTVAEMIKLAGRALKVSPLCADAYALLATYNEPGTEKSVDLWRMGVEAGKKALGPNWRQEYEGVFWGALETRPLMRCLHGLALTQRERKAYDEAITILRELLRLNPNDNQGARYVLVSTLLAASRDDELKDIIQAYPDDGAGEWMWNMALAAFRSHGDAEESRAVLQQALAANEHVPDYLLARKRMPRRLPEYISYGDESEAVAYVAECRSIWNCSEGALDWLKSHGPPTRPAPKRAKQRRAPLH